MHRRTLGILPPSDVDELLNVADFLGLEEHDGTCQLGMAASRASAAVRTILAESCAPCRCRRPPPPCSHFPSVAEIQIAQLYSFRRLPYISALAQKDRRLLRSGWCAPLGTAHRYAEKRKCCIDGTLQGTEPTVGKRNVR